MFQSDNGAEGWAMDSGEDPTATDIANAQPGTYEKLGTDYGRPQTIRFPFGLTYGTRWAEVSAAPLGLYKSTMGEGGISVPAIVKLPGQAKSLPPFTRFTHVTDNTATFLALAGVQAPSKPAAAQIDAKTGVDKNKGKVVYQGRNVYPVTGHSLVEALKVAASGPVRNTPSARKAMATPC